MTVFNMMKEVGVFTMKCPRNHDMQFKEDAKHANKMGYCPECRNSFSIMRGSFFAVKKIKAIDNFLLTLFIYLARAPLTLLQQLSTMKEESITHSISFIDNNLFSTHRSFERGRVEDWGRGEGG